MSEQKRKMVHDIFINVHCMSYPISHGHWLKQEKLGLELPSRMHLNGLTTSVQAPPYLFPRLYDSVCTVLSVWEQD